MKRKKDGITSNMRLSASGVAVASPAADLKTMMLGHAPVGPQIRRQTADGIIEAVSIGGRIRLETLVELSDLLREKTDYKFHIEIAVNTGALLKTLDNEEDAQETIRRLRGAPNKKKSDG